MTQIAIVAQIPEYPKQRQRFIITAYSEYHCVLHPQKGGVVKLNHSIARLEAGYVLRGVALLQSRQEGNLETLQTKRVVFVTTRISQANAGEKPWQLNLSVGTNTAIKLLHEV